VGEEVGEGGGDHFSGIVEALDLYWHEVELTTTDNCWTIAYTTTWDSSYQLTAFNFWASCDCYCARNSDCRSEIIKSLDCYPIHTSLEGNRSIVSKS